MSGTVGNGNVEAERQLEAEEMGIDPSWGTGMQGWAMGITMVVIRRLEMVTGIELKGGSELRLSLLKICEWRAREIVKIEKHHRKQYNENSNTLKGQFTPMSKIHICLLPEVLFIYLD